MKKKHLLAIIALVIITNLMTYGLVGTGIVPVKNHLVIASDNQEMIQGLQKITALEKRIDSDYYKDVDTEDLMDGALKGMFEATDDPYTTYYTEEEYEEIIESSTGEFEGIGVAVSETDDGLTKVIMPYANTPAGNAGIQTGDIIVKVDDEDVTTSGIDEVVSKMRGETGTTVKVTVLRDSKLIDYALTRETIDVPSVTSEKIGDVGYIKITSFTTKTGDEFDAEIDQLLEQNMTSLVIDLRYNLGGVVDSSVAVADRLLGETTVVYEIDKNGERTDYSSSDDLKIELPIAVLVNGATASSSEILAGALQDLKAADLVGTQTYGKGVVQEVVSLSDGSGFKLTSAEYFTPNGRNINDKGLTPDIVIEQAEDYQQVLNVPKDQDVQLQKALQVLEEKS